MDKLIETKSDDIWADVAKIMAHTKYKFLLSKPKPTDGLRDTAIWLVDIPKVIEKLKEKYTITLNDNS